jgi:hypothetical protein
VAALGIAVAMHGGAEILAARLPTHDIWEMSNTTVMAWLSVAVVVGFALLMTALAVRVFTRSAVR